MDLGLSKIQGMFQLQLLYDMIEVSVKVPYGGEYSLDLWPET
jgi:hypothetical protein